VQGMVSGAFDRLSAEVARYEGIVEKFAGDAVLALFGVPAAHEDDPERAVRAALEMQAAFIVQAQELLARGRPELQLRIGIETGEVLVDLERVAGERERMVTGDPVNTAARLQSVAAPGAIVVGPGTYASTREVVEYEELEPLDLKGKSLPVPAWRAVRVKARRGGIRTPLGIEAPLIGRDEELSLLKETVRRLTADRRPHLVTVIGAAGVGKSRLTWELEKYLDGLPGTYHWRKGRYLSYGQASFGGLVELIRSDAGVREDDTEEEGRRRVATRMAALGLGRDEPVERALGVLLGAASEATSSRDDLFEAWRRYLEAIARVAPLVLVLEDIHWADEGSLDFVDFLARWAEAPILVLCLARHELLERRPSWGGGIANSSTIVLEPLGHAENEALLDALLPGSLPAGFKERIVAVAEGNPLFSEELVRMLIDRGIARPGAHGWELVAPVEELDIPTSIHALLAARLDSLPAQEKRLTQAAAVVGRIFWDAVLAHVVAGASPDLDRLLRGLRVKELVVAREPSSLADSREYGFRHVLIRDVAYESVPKAERAEKHLQVADWAEQRLAREDEMVELLASHYRSALAYREEAMIGDESQLSDIRRRLLEYSRRAGRRAAELWDASSAAAWLRVAIEQARRLELPATERAELAKEYLDSAITGEPVEDALAIGREAVELLTSTGGADVSASPVLAGIRGHLGQLIYGKNRPDEARAMLEDALAAIEAGPPTEARARLRWRLGWLTWRAFSPADAVPILESAVAEARAVGVPEVERRAIHDLGIALEYTGRSGEGLAMLEQSMEMARAAGDHELMLRSYINLPAFLETATWDHERAEALMREGLDRARRGGQRLIACFLLSNLASTLAERGQFEAATALLEEARSMALEVGDENLIGLSHGFTALVMARYGRLAEARHWHAESIGHGAQEPQGSGLEAMLEAMLTWDGDPRLAVSTMAARLRELPRDADALRMLARMARRTGQLDEGQAGHETRTAMPGAPRLEAYERWRTTLLGPATEEGIAGLLDIGERFRSGGYAINAADALSDAALLARQVAPERSAELAQSSRELYRELGVDPLFGILDERASIKPGTAAG
jgi:tetratricopeptide (TPR) repeat protein